LYGTFFKRFYKETREVDKITPEIVLKMLESALSGVKEIGNAEVGDKTMIDTLSPAVNGFKDALSKKLSFEDSLNICVASARTGCDSTKEMIARIGRSSRLGDRSRGVLDAGAVSCYIILDSFAKSVKSIIINQQENL
jgi:phosphoenolpyruvate---glycerone phosphotransferase subunit DhaL